VGLEASPDRPEQVEPLPRAAPGERPRAGADAGASGPAGAASERAASPAAAGEFDDDIPF
jgi:hypothetical protein